MIKMSCKQIHFKIHFLISLSHIQSCYYLTFFKPFFITFENQVLLTVFIDTDTFWQPKCAAKTNFLLYEGCGLFVCAVIYKTKLSTMWFFFCDVCFCKFSPKIWFKCDHAEQFWSLGTLMSAVNLCLFWGVWKHCKCLINCRTYTFIFNIFMQYDSRSPAKQSVPEVIWRSRYSVQ